MMFGDEETLNSRWRHCDTSVGLAAAIVARILRAARHAEYHADHHVDIITRAVRGLVEREVLPELVNVIVMPERDFVVEEGPGRWLYAGDKISTDPSETLFGPLSAFIECIYEGNWKTGDQTLIRRRTVACLILLRTVQKSIDYRRIVGGRAKTAALHDG